jgi:hypothetical protein
MGDSIEIDTASLPFARGVLGAMLEVVAHRLRMPGIVGEVWVDEVLASMNDVGIFTIRQFVMHVMTLNERLAIGGHPELSPETINAMLHEACEMFETEGSVEENTENTPQQ